MNVTIQACFILLLLVATAAQAERSTSRSGPLILESDLALVELTWPTFTLYGKWPNGTVFRAESFQLTFMSVSEGATYPQHSPFTNQSETLWDSSLLYNIAELPTNCSLTSAIAAFVDGTPALRNSIACALLVPNGANLNIVFSMFNISGQLPWGLRYVNVTAGQLSYETYIDDWPFINNNARIQLLGNITVNTGSYGVYDPFQQINGSVFYSPFKHFEMTSIGPGPLNIDIYNALWSLVDNPETADDILLVPNPFRWYPTNFTSAGLTGGWIVVGFVFPFFHNYTAWDPSVLVSLFDNSEPPSPTTHPSAKVQIAVGVVVPCVLIATAAIATYWFIHRQQTFKASAERLNA